MFTQLEYRYDLRVQMGRTIAAHHGHRLAQLVAAIIEDRADMQDWVGIRLPNSQLKDDKRSILRHWADKREEKLPKHCAQHRLFVAVPFQDDFIVIVVGSRGACVAEEQIPRIMEELGIQLSQKEESNKPFSDKFVALGAEFDLRGGRPIMKPRPKLIEKFKKRLNGFRINKGKLIGVKQMQEFCGLFEFMSRFSKAGFTPVSLAYACLRVALRTKNPLCPVSKELLEAAESMLEEFETNSGVPVIRNPCYLHPGKHGFTSDARGLENNMTGGWGLYVGGWCLSGAWSPAIIQGMKDGILSINPLELLTCAMTLCFAKSRSVLGNGAHVVWRNDNESAVTDLNSDRAKSAAMLEALRIVTETEKWTQIHVHGQYISSQDNVVADLLSRGRADEALSAGSKYFGFQARMVNENLEFNDFFNRKVEAAYRGAGRKVPTL